MKDTMPLQESQTKNKEKTLVAKARLSHIVNQIFASTVGLVLETFPIEEFNPTKGGV